jgi:hypothetical protein
MNPTKTTQNGAGSLTANPVDCVALPAKFVDSRDSHNHITDLSQLNDERASSGIIEIRRRA